MDSGPGSPTLPNESTLSLASYRSPLGRREIYAVRVDGEIFVFDVLTTAVRGDHDERLVAEALVTLADARAAARRYLAHGRANVPATHVA